MPPTGEPRIRVRSGRSRSPERLAGPPARQPGDADSPAFLLAHGAITQAKQNHSELWTATPPSRRALVLSTTKAEITALERTLRGEPCSLAVRRRMVPGALARDLAALHEIQGPVRCVSTACISGLLALQIAARQIQAGETDLAMVVRGGFNFAFRVIWIHPAESARPGRLPAI